MENPSVINVGVLLMKFSINFCCESFEYIIQSDEFVSKDTEYGKQII